MFRPVIACSSCVIAHPRLKISAPYMEPFEKKLLTPLEENVEFVPAPPPRVFTFFLTERAAQSAKGFQQNHTEGLFKKKKKI